MRETMHQLRTQGSAGTFQPVDGVSRGSSSATLCIEFVHIQMKVEFAAVQPLAGPSI
jgi:hypothetical protein